MWSSKMPMDKEFLLRATPPPAQSGGGRRKSTSGIRAWMVVSESRQPYLEEAGKHLIVRRTGLPARDLRVLDPQLSYPSTILGRERAIVINLEHDKAVITAMEVLVPNSKDPLVAPFLQDLQTRVLSSIDATMPSAAESSDTDTNHAAKAVPSYETQAGSLRTTLDDYNNGGTKVLPFEFRALEVCLESACRLLKSEMATGGTGGDGGDDLQHNRHGRSKVTQRYRSKKLLVSRGQSTATTSRPPTTLPTTTRPPTTIPATTISPTTPVDPSTLSPAYTTPFYPAQHPSYPAQHPSYPGLQPPHPGQQPPYPGQQPPYPGQQPSYPGMYQPSPLYPPYPQQPYYPPRPTPPESSTPAGSVENKVLIEPMGDTFNPHKEPTHRIRDIIRSRFEVAYISWTKIPQNVRDMWFHEFEKSFYWLPQHHMIIRRNFERRGAARLRDMMSAIRRSGVRPLWLGEDVWSELCILWGKKEYVDQRARNKQNRASDLGGLGQAKHTGGSIPHTEHHKRMKKLLGRDPTIAELHERTHRKQQSQHWVDAKSKKVYDDFIRMRESQSGEDTSGRDDFQIWSEAAGGKKKGKVYGLGSQSYALDPKTSLSSYPDTAVEEIIRRKVASFMTDEIATQVRTQVEAMEAEMRRKMDAELEARIRATMTDLGKKPVEVEEDDDDESDQEYDEDDDEEDDD